MSSACASHSLKSATIQIGWLGQVITLLIIMAVLVDLESLNLNCKTREDSLCFYVIVIGELSLLFHSLMLYGAYCEIAVLMLPYVTIIFTLLLASVIGFFFLVTFGTTQNAFSKEGLIFAVFLYLIYCYFWLI
ncbi:hypothetical protein L9F63_013939, partial [Diploptera punctata]